MVAHVGNGKLFFDHIGYPVKIVMIEKICRFEYRKLLESQLTNIEDNEDEQANLQTVDRAGMSSGGKSERSSYSYGRESNPHCHQ
ncbi:50S ribosomal protein L22, partial [Dissostichus eleginoides]